MPTKKELEELKDKCIWKKTTQNGKTGFKITGTNGNSIFLPIAGERCDSSLKYTGENGFYWSSSPCDGAVFSYGLICYNQSFPKVSIYFRCNGISVRPVTE